ncbi:MAG: hypothetical protein SVX43_22250 [Cyanobacteriota bacterium]|nr:hypothetical protein [Cyanobacteriota bacterium]
MSKRSIVPFGRVGTGGEADRAIAIASALAALARRAVHFKPEKIIV